MLFPGIVKFKKFFMRFKTKKSCVDLELEKAAYSLMKYITNLLIQKIEAISDELYSTKRECLILANSLIKLIDNCISKIE